METTLWTWSQVIHRVWASWKLNVFKGKGRGLVFGILKPISGLGCLALHCSSSLRWGSHKELLSIKHRRWWGGALILGPPWRSGTPYGFPWSLVFMWIFSFFSWKAYFFHQNLKELHPGWCSSVDWERAYEPKGHWFNSQSGYMPQLRAMSPVGGVQETATHWCFSLSLSPSLPLSLKINK